MTTTTYDDYPTPKEKRIGAKVKWYYYDNEADARLASGTAEREAMALASLGYDFGFQAPGSIRPPRVGAFHADLYEVCLP